MRLTCVRYMVQVSLTLFACPMCVHLLDSVLLIPHWGYKNSFRATFTLSRVEHLCVDLEFLSTGIRRNLKLTPKIPALTLGCFCHHFILQEASSELIARESTVCTRIDAQCVSSQVKGKRGWAKYWDKILIELHHIWQRPLGQTGVARWREVGVVVWIQ